MRFKFTLAGEDLGELDVDKMTLKQAFSIKAASGLTPKAMFDGLAEGDPDALQTVVWFLKQQRGEFVDRASIDFAMSDLNAERVDEEPANPTEEAGTSTPAETSTSGS